MKKPALSLIVLGILGAGALWAAAQESSVTISAQAIPARVTLGDEIRLVIQAETPKGFSVLPPPPSLRLDPFELKNSQVLPGKTGSNRVRQTVMLTLTIFELGDFKIPSVPVDFRDLRGQTAKVWTQPLDVKVISVGNSGGARDIQPIKGPVSFSLLKLWIAAGAVLAVLLAAVLAVRFFRRAQKIMIDPESLLPAHERVLCELGRLKKSAFLESGRVKEFYSELSDILRRYLERRFGVEALERTTAELLAEFKNGSFNGVAIESLKWMLENADLVKFAKVQPPRALASEMEKALTDFVEKTRPASPIGRPAAPEKSK